MFKTDPFVNKPSLEQPALLPEIKKALPETVFVATLVVMVANLTICETLHILLICSLDISLGLIWNLRFVAHY